ncbi:ectoine/hydroxyectoine ABC transporter permease subunit EhuD [Phyllobacterium chamaecytisi]|uniref:ectoine/hydroxyectoine ABC transporter permease subunit EhuD n=1 Tax=Phyllobacterium chamaecytisi TaxID=2876082 RepID=UPI001CCFD844|nr:ectoine/hydroxyectoine ABC transporter permease subunit EhuD [Phyllobacterium sp. KW56]MBZ9603122.1 ectoine/hydroxyectoine ABC transporter permease subunit EhuD [Phyllobacterium sp. KW56]
MTILGIDILADWFRLSVVTVVLPKLIAAASVTIYVALLAFVGALVIAIPLLWAQRSHLPLIARPAVFLSDFIRSTPLLLQVYFYFFVLPQIGVMLPAIATGVLALSIHYGCYVSEAYRAGLEALPVGQRDAVIALGFSRFDAYRYIIVPQLIPFLIPALGNLLVSIFKETPLLASIAVTDIMFVAMQHGADHFQYIEPITLCGLIFLALSLATSFVIRVLENAASQTWLGRRNIRG